MQGVDIKPLTSNALIEVEYLLSVLFKNRDLSGTHFQESRGHLVRRDGFAD